MCYAGYAKLALGETDAAYPLCASHLNHFHDYSKAEGEWTDDLYHRAIALADMALIYSSICVTQRDIDNTLDWFQAAMETYRIGYKSAEDLRQR